MGWQILVNLIRQCMLKLKTHSGFHSLFLKCSIEYTCLSGVWTHDLSDDGHWLHIGSCISNDQLPYDHGNAKEIIAKNCYKLIYLFSMVLKRNRKKRQNYLNSSKSHQGELGGRRKRLRSSRQKQMQMMMKKKMSLQVNSLPYVAVWVLYEVKSKYRLLVNFEPGHI